MGPPVLFVLDELVLKLLAELDDLRRLFKFLISILDLSPKQHVSDLRLPQQGSGSTRRRLEIVDLYCDLGIYIEGIRTQDFFRVVPRCG